MTLIANRVAVFEECCGIPNHAAIRHSPLHPDVLHDILGLDRTAEHAVGDAEETATHFRNAERPSSGQVVTCKAVVRVASCCPP